MKPRIISSPNPKHDVFVLYNILITTAFIIASPYLLWRLISQRKYWKGFLERFGIFSREKISKCKKPMVWFHAVSVGETSAVYPLYKAFKQKYPNSRVVFSTTTATGQAWIRGRLDHDDIAIYFPIDLYWIVESVLNRICPDLFITAETEIWPNFWWSASRKGAKIALVNGRISNRSFRKYSRIVFFLKQVLNRLSFITVQTEEDARRFLVLGAPAERLTVSGNLKFEISLSEQEISLQKKSLKESLGIADGLMIVGGSTHPGEEKILMDIYLNLKRSFPMLRLILAPRHPERFAEVKNLIEEGGLAVFLASARGERKWVADEVLLVDVMGELPLYYALATVVFMGKSLTAHGGQNLLEPAALGKVILFGPYMENFRQVADLFLKSHAAAEVRDSTTLESEMRKFLSSESLRRNLQVTAKTLIEKNKGALAKTLERMEERLACQH